jgi:putative tryptophan/tyrosine transport system substrate-binding protein
MATGKRIKGEIAAVAICAMLFALCIPAEAQQPKKVPRIGYLVAGSASSISTYVEAFRKGLRELGYIDGKNILIEYRYAEGHEKRLPDLAEELVHLKVDLIFVGNNRAAQAAKNATGTIPIVVTLTSDPVATGLIRSLARPGENVTGLTQLSSSPELTGKRLELLKEAFPEVRLVAVLRNPESVPASIFKEMQAAAQMLGVQLEPVDVRQPDDFDKNFRAITKKRADALMVLSSPIFNVHEAQIVRLAAANRLPAMYPRAEAVEAGGLMYYGTDDADVFRRAATYVDKNLERCQAG